jgi:uncharacterized protein YjbJ (UPF0337 family)
VRLERTTRGLLLRSLKSEFYRFELNLRVWRRKPEPSAKRRIIASAATLHFNSIFRRDPMSSTSDKIKGAANEAIGNVKQAAGKAVGNDRLVVKGAVQERKGEAQQAVGKAKSAVKKVIDG